MKSILSYKKAIYKGRGHDHLERNRTYKVVISMIVGDDYWVEIKSLPRITSLFLGYRYESDLLRDWELIEEV